MLAHVGTIGIETERLILRKFEYTDDENMLKYWISDPEIQSLYSEPVYSTKQEVKINDVSCFSNYKIGS
ncbi:hypothetical protein ACUH7Y_16525 [Clostridium beijerinckii]|uniref:hypothetical protein n=1 Tax=Clostridium beijerinckii TaxID=1520 RepID=UPI00197EAFEE|nr:hypothetical protein [Clostridium beijerinckii]